MYPADMSELTLPLIQSIENAILLGNAREIGDVLEAVSVDDDFPDALRYGLESLYYFRLHYGKGGDMEPASDKERKTMLQMEAYWGRELIEAIAYYPQLAQSA